MTRPHMLFDRTGSTGLVEMNLIITAHQADILAQIISNGIISLGNAPPPFPPDLYVAESIVNAIIHEDIEVLKVSFGPDQPPMNPNQMVQAIRRIRPEEPDFNVHTISGKRADETQYPQNNPHGPNDPTD